jgi:hypothetical protein
MTKSKDTNKQQYSKSKFWLLVFVICLLFVSWNLFLGIYNVSAQTASSSADTIRDSVKQKVTEELAQIKKGVAKKGFIGSVTNISDGKVTINTLTGFTRQALVVADTTIKLSSGGDGTPGDLKVGQYVLAMGDVDSQNSMTTKRLLVVTKPSDDPRKVIFGSLTKVSSTSFSIGSDSYKITSASKFTGKTKVSDLAVNSKIMAIINNGIATRINLLSTPTSSSPSATPKP